MPDRADRSTVASYCTRRPTARFEPCPTISSAFPSPIAHCTAASISLRLFGLKEVSDIAGPEGMRMGFVPIGFVATGSDSFNFSRSTRESQRAISFPPSITATLANLGWGRDRYHAHRARRILSQQPRDFAHGARPIGVPHEKRVHASNANAPS